MINEEYKCPQCGDLVYVNPYHMETWLIGDISKINNTVDLRCKYIRHIEWQCHKVQNHNGTVEQGVDDFATPLEMPNEFRTN